MLAVGAVATNVIGRRLLARGESWLMLIPVFRTIYAPVKQLVVAFSPDNEYGFKRVVMVEDPAPRLGDGVPDQGVHGRSRARARKRWWRSTCRRTICIWETSCVYPRERAFFPDLTVEEGIRIFLTGGMSLPGRIGRQATETEPAQ